MGCADTCIWMGDGEAASVASARIITARKPQVCCECGDPIRPGDRYEFVSGCWDGTWSSFRTCLVCHEIRTRFSCEGWVYGRLREATKEGMFPCWKEKGPFDWLAKVSNAAGAKLRGWYEAWEPKP